MDASSSKPVPECSSAPGSSRAGSAELEACLNEHNGEYVRLFGIDPKSKKADCGDNHSTTERSGLVRLLSPKAPNTFRRSNTDTASSANRFSNQWNTSLSQEVVEQVRPCYPRGVKETCG